MRQTDHGIKGKLLGDPCIVEHVFVEIQLLLPLKQARLLGQVDFIGLLIRVPGALSAQFDRCVEALALFPSHYLTRVRIGYKHIDFQFRIEGRAFYLIESRQIERLTTLTVQAGIHRQIDFVHFKLIFFLI